MLLFQHLSAGRQLPRALRQPSRDAQASADHGPAPLQQHRRVVEQGQGRRRLQRHGPVEQVRLHRRFKVVRHPDPGHDLRRQAVPNHRLRVRRDSLIAKSNI